MPKIKISEPGYPTLLTHIDKPPSCLFYKGELSLLEKTCIAIVGTRRYSEYGEVVTRSIIRDLAAYDVAIVSGLAKGIDTIAHTTALECNLPTIAVLGSGIDCIYPSQNSALAQQIIEHGLILSEHAGSTPPCNYFFPLRNRIISGISLLTLVIEAKERSGALITARYALEQGREIAVVPGDIHRPNSGGIVHLLQQGAAYPVASGRDIINLLSVQPSLKFTTSTQPATPSAKRAPGELQILEALSTHRATHIENLHRKLSIPITELMITLTMLEAQGIVRTTQGRYLKNS